MSKKNVLKLASGTLVGQILNFLIIPVLARLYSSQDLGVYGVFLSLRALLLVLSTGAYENAMLAEKRNKSLSILLALISFLSLTISIVVFLLCKTFILLGLSFAPTNTFAACIAISSLLGGFNQGSYYLLNRLSKYNILACIDLITSASFGIIAIVIYKNSFFGNGLLYSTVISQGLVTILMLHGFKSSRIFSKSSFSLRRVRFVALKHIGFPKYLILSSFVDRFCAQFIIISSASFFGDSASGSILLVQKTISIPAKLIGTSVSTVYKQKASQLLIETGSCRHLFMKTLRYLLFSSLLPFIIIFVFSPLIFPTIYGNNWTSAGLYAQILAIPSLLSFIVSPLSSVILLKGNQRIDLALQTALALLLLLYSIIIPGLSVAQFLTGYSFIFSIKYSLEFFASYRISFNYRLS